MAALPALYGKNAIIRYGSTLELEADSYRLNVSAPTVDTTNITIYNTLKGLGSRPNNALTPTLTSLAGDQQKRFEEFGTPQQMTFGGIRRGKIDLSGICSTQDKCPHIGNYVRILLTHSNAFGNTGVITVIAIVVDFNINQSVKDYMRWTLSADTTGDFDITQS